MSEFLITNGRVLLPSGSFENKDILVQDGVIAEVFTPSSETASSDIRRIDASDMWVLPGIIDIHGDAFERQLMPRPGVHFPFDVAFLETDRQLVANGITTAFHGVTYSWEPGLRGRDNFLQIMNTLSELKTQLLSDSLLHLRFETFNLEALEEIEKWMRDGSIGILAFNNHTPKIYEERFNNRKVTAYADRTGLTADQFVDLVESIMERQEQVPNALERLAAAARQMNIPQLSHDDDTREVRDTYNRMGCNVSEFPINLETILHAKELNNPVVMGAPNVLRSGSHNGGISALEMILANNCDILASDYYYPAPLVAVFKLIREHNVPIDKAWNLISKNPAEASNLDDRSTIDVGKRADIVVVNHTSDVPQILQTIANGVVAYSIEKPIVQNEKP